MTFDRRQFLRVTATGTVLGLLGADHALSPGLARDGYALASPALLALLGAPHVRAVGARYRHEHPAEATAPALTAALLETISRAGRASWVGVVPLADVIRADFAQGRTVVVDGWLLSLTEARQCALYSLQSA
jgi:hypothetical protein